MSDRMKLIFDDMRVRDALSGYSYGYHYKNTGKRFFRCVFSVPMTIGG